MYTTQSKVEAYTDQSLTSNQASQVSDWISAVERWINNYTGKRWDNSVSEERFFDGNGDTELIIDEFTSINSVETLEQDGDTDETLTEGHGNDFLTYPLNTTEKYKLVLTNDSSIAVFPKGDRRVKVDAVWGAATTVPEDIQLAATKLVGEVVLDGIQGGKIRQVSLGDYNIQFFGDKAKELGITEILDQYRTLEL